MLVVAISDLLSLSLDEAMILLHGISRITSATMYTLNLEKEKDLPLILSQFIHATMEDEESENAFGELVQAYQMAAENRRRCLVYIACQMKIGGAVQERQGTAGHEIVDSESILKIANTLKHAA